MKNKYRIPKCPNCGKQLKKVSETEYDTYEFNTENGCYYIKGFGDMDISCPNCDEDLVGVFTDGVCNFKAKEI